MTFKNQVPKNIDSLLLFSYIAKYNIFSFIRAAIELLNYYK